MGARLLILIVIAAGLAVYFAMPRKAANPEEGPDVGFMGDNGESLKDIRKSQMTIAEQPIEGKEPDEEPSLEASVEVDTSMGKNRLYFTISEAHGYYVDTFHLRAWRKGDNVSGPEDSPLVVPVMLNQYVKANEILRTCIEVTPAELANVHGDIGSTEDWDVVVDTYGRARTEDPDPLPTVSDVGTCH